MAKQQQYLVGQVLFVGSNKKNQVIPVQVTERVTRETVEGSRIVYSVVTPKHPEKAIDLSRVDGQIFTSLDEARSKMIAKAERASQEFLVRAKREIDRMVSVAATAAKRFPNGQAVAPPPKEDDLQIDITDEAATYPDEPTAYDNVGDVEHLPPLPPTEEGEEVIMVPGPDGKEVPAKVRSVRVTARQD